MGTFAVSAPLYKRGDVVIVPFPASAAGGPTKKRPAVVIAAVNYGAGADFLCMLVTSQAAPDPMRITLSAQDVQGGSLPLLSYLRPLYLYTASERLLSGKIGTLSAAKLADAVQALTQLVDPPTR